jgi:hypothetical protein
MGLEVWRQIDFSTLGSEQATREISLSQWLPALNGDKCSPETLPPLSFRGASHMGFVAM